jgi:hypothetical protein
VKGIEITSSNSSSITACLFVVTETWPDTCSFRGHVLVSTNLFVAADTCLSQPISGKGLFWLSDVMSHYVCYCFVIFQFVCYYRYCVALDYFQRYFHLLSTCSIVAVSRCMFVIPVTNIGGGAGSSLSCLILPSVSACCRTSDLLVVVS